MPRTADIDWNGLHLRLDADRAAYAPDHRTLLIADVHFGKAAAFRDLGSPVPEAVTSADLGRLTTLIDRYAPETLIILGDFLHARQAHNHATLGAMRDWRAHHDLHIHLVRGNHDIRAGDPPPDLAIECTDPPYALGPVDLDHHPPAVPARPTIAGHIHPSISLRDGPIATIRARCFHFARTVALLPAFGAFTGSESIAPISTDRTFAVGDDALVEVFNRSAQGCHGVAQRRYGERPNAH